MTRMHKLSSIVLLFVFLCGSTAEPYQRVPDHSVVYEKGSSRSIPRPVAESEPTKDCPVGFAFAGKQCAKTVTASPEVVCPEGTTFSDNKCAKYVGKVAECPYGYTLSKGSCSKQLSASPELICPAGFSYNGKETCTTKIALPDKSYCPSGTHAKGDLCFRAKYEPVEFRCPSNSRLVGKHCQREEVYDCTPKREPTYQKKEEEYSKPYSLRNVQPSKGRSLIYTIPAQPTVVEEYVVREDCKRIINEPATPFCPKQGNLHGKMCEIDEVVHPIVKHGGFTEEHAKALSICPDGFSQTKKDECIATEKIQPEFACPHGTVNVGKRCATFTKPQTVCPKGYSLEGKTCSKTVYAPPIVEYTITYSCVGKECADGDNY